MREVLLISSDQQITRLVRWKLEHAGYAVALSPSLEASFLKVGRADPFAVVLDARSISLRNWSDLNILAWFHRRSPIVLLSNEPCPALEQECDYCFSRRAAPDRLVSCLRRLCPPD